MLLLALVATSSHAATLRVDAAGGAAYTSIQAAVLAATDGDTIEVAPGTYAEAVDLSGRSVAIVGTAGAAATVLDATGLAEAWRSWAFILQRAEQDVSITGFTVRNSGGRGVYAHGASLALEDVTFQDLGDATLDGGAVWATAAQLSLHGCSFDGGAGYNGGQLYATGSVVQLADTTLRDGSATYGGALYLTDSSLALSGVTVEYAEAAQSGGAALLWNTTTTVDATLFEGNRSQSGSGGGLYAAYGTLEITGSTFTDNTCDAYSSGYYGGGLYAGSLAAPLVVQGSTFSGNVNHSGGALFVDGAEALVSDSSFSGNWAYYGGGVYVNGGAWAEEATVYEGNTGYYGAGGLCLAYADGQVSTATFDENVSTYGSGGAIQAYGYGSYGLQVQDSAFTENVAYYAGGGVYLVGYYDGASFAGSRFDDNEGLYSNGGAIRAYYYTPLAVSASTFEGNLTYTDGGALSVEYDSELVVSDTHLVANTAGSTGGAIYFQAYTPRTLRVTDSVLQANAAASEGGALRASLAQLALERTQVVGNTAEELGFGGGLRLSGLFSARLVDSRIEGNAATYGGGLYLDASGPTQARNLVVLANSAQHGGGLALVDSEALELVNIALVGNHAEQTGAAVYQYQAPLSLRNAIVAHHTGSAALYTRNALDVEGSALAYAVLWDNALGHGGGAWESDGLPGTDTVQADPGFARAATAGGATLVLARDSGVLDRGDPLLQDLDGSRSDPGAWGGPQVAVQDEDGDGHDSSVDCDEADPLVHPGAAETWYDGLDQDCLLASDLDADGDGADSAEHGGTDCDDADPSVVDCPDEEAPAGDGGDAGGGDAGGAGGGQPGPGGVPSGAEASGAGCASAPGGAHLALALLAGLATRRRRAEHR